MVRSTDNSIEKMYYPIFEMKIFQSLFSNVRTTGCDRLVRHNYVFDPELLQPVPKYIRDRRPKAAEKESDRLGVLGSVFFSR